LSTVPIFPIFSYNFVIVRARAVIVRIGDLVAYYK